MSFNTKIIVERPAGDDTVRIQQMVRGSFGTIEHAGTVWTVYRNSFGILFLEDLDLFENDSARLRDSSFRVRILPEGTKVTTEYTVL